jgi:hypothetical protein
MRDLAARKQLLITESEINRLLLEEDGKAIAREVHDFSQRTMQLRGLMTMALAAFSAVKSGASAPPAQKRSWFEPIVNTVRLGTSIWSTFWNGKGRE